MKDRVGLSCQALNSLPSFSMAAREVTSRAVQPPLLPPHSALWLETPPLDFAGHLLPPALPQVSSKVCALEALRTQVLVLPCDHGQVAQLPEPLFPHL